MNEKEKIYNQFHHDAPIQISMIVMMWDASIKRLHLALKNLILRQVSLNNSAKWLKRR